MKNVLSIAGSDPSGGAGIQADLKTFAALGVYGMAAITALTAQNTRGVTGVQMVGADFARAQIKAIFDDIKVDALKIGMTGNSATIIAIANMLRTYKPRFVVLDPVMVATSGDALLSDNGARALVSQLIPLADIITPNLPEGRALLGKDADGDKMAKGLLNLGAKAVLLKGGHGDGDKAVDIFASQDGAFEHLSAPRVNTKNTHGTGCTLAAAIAAFAAKGTPTLDACRAAKEYVTRAIKTADKLNVGHGHGAVNHLCGN